VRALGWDQPVGKQFRVERADTSMGRVVGVMKDFVYRINLGWCLFAASALGALMLAVLTVSFHTLKAASTNPSDSLRYE